MSDDDKKEVIEVISKLTQELNSLGFVLSELTRALRELSEKLKD